MSPRRDWSKEERTSALDIYFKMYANEYSGRRYIRKRFYEEFARAYPTRSQKALEYKLQNISACLIEMGMAPLRGMAPAFNYQRVLLDQTAERISVLESLVLQSVAEPPIVPNSPTQNDIDKPPHWQPSKFAAEARSEPIARKINFAEREQSNRQLGLAGEQWVVELERRMIHDAGNPSLAKNVRHVSQEEGDGLGYDIESFDINSGTKRFIEVKTTRAGIWTPFSVTCNEVRVSLKLTSRYWLYRVHSFGSRTRVYKLPNAIESSCDLTATNYRAFPRVLSA